MRKKFLVSIIVFVLLCFSLITSVFAESQFILDSENSKIYNLVVKCEADERVQSGQYYYFVSYFSGACSYFAVLVDKSIIDIEPYLRYQLNVNGYYQYILALTTKNCFSNNYCNGVDFINIEGYTGRYGDAVSFYNNYGHSGIIVSGSESENIYPFATNYDNPIKVYGTENDFFYLTPTVLQTTLKKVEMSVVLTEVVKLIPLILVVVVCFLGLRKALRMLLMLLRRC